MTASAWARSLTVAAVSATAVVALPGLVAAQTSEPRVVIRDVGPGRAGRWLRDALAAPHLLVRSDSIHPLVLGRDTTIDRTLIVVGGHAKIAAVVRGDVVVVGGDLFLRPGVDVQGRAVAIGGGVYRTTLGRVGRGLYSNRDFTYRITTLADGTLVLDYQTLEERDVRVLSLPGLYGIRIPAYDRTDGLSLPFGPTFSIDTGRIEIDALGIYRSQLGEVDPELAVRAAIGRRLAVHARAGRTTATNDRWIRGDYSNSFVSLVAGRDTRNYYRADRAEARVFYRWESATSRLTVHGGGLAEEARSARPDTGARGGPWSLFGRRDAEEGMLRPNPRVARGRIVSALAGARLEYEDQGLEAALRTETEVPFDVVGGGRWIQMTVDGDAAFPTFGTQRVELESHAVLSSGDITPPQRFAYLGGSGTLPTFDLLEFGGDHLFFAEGRYIIPVDQIRIRVLGSPTLTLRYMIGSAGVGTLPTLEQNVGARLSISVLRVDYVVDPSSRKSKLTFGLTFGR